MGFMRDKAKGTDDYEHGKGLPTSIVAAIKPIYSRLSNDKLLKKCLDCKTQNQNNGIQRNQRNDFEPLAKGSICGV